MMRKRIASAAGITVALVAAVLITMVLANGLAASGDGDQTIYRVEGDVQKPVRVSGEPPAYPEEARKERVEGLVVVLAVIDREGNVASTEIVETDREDLGASAVAAIADWKFEPATLRGEPVPVYYNLTVRYRLDGGEKPEKT